MSSVSSRMEGKVILYSLQVVLVSFVEKVICTLSAFYKPTYQTAIWAITLGFIGISILFLIIHRKKIFSSLSYVPRKTTKSILKFSVPYLPVLLLSWLNGSIPLFALRSYVDYSSIGIYTNAVTIANILSLIQAGFSTYWNPFIYENYKIKENEKKIQRIVAIIIFMLFFLALLVILFQDIIYLLVGEKYRASKLFFPFLMFTPICNCLGDITGIGIMLSKKSYLNIITFSGCAITNILLSFLLVPQIGVMGAGLATAGSALVMLALRSKLAVRYYRAFNNEWKIICPVILMTGASIINGWFDNSLKYIFIILIILMLCAVFREELSYVLKSARKGIKHFFR